MKDPYETLGLDRSADNAEVKRAFRMLAMRYHPDMSTETGAAQRFEEVRKAADEILNRVGDFAPGPGNMRVSNICHAEGVKTISLQSNCGFMPESEKSHHIHAGPQAHSPRCRRSPARCLQHELEDRALDQACAKSHASLTGYGEAHQ